jgi:polysaccharide biosynthesis transport protein
MSSELRIPDLGNVLRRRAKFIVGIAAVATGLVAVAAITVPPSYTAKSQIRVEPRGLVNIQASVIEQAPDEASVLTEMTAVTSHELLQQVVLSLPADPDFRKAVAELARKPAADGVDPRRLLNAWIPRSWLTATGAPGSLSLRQLQRHLKVYQEQGSHILAVSISSTSPAEAAAVANRITQLYVQRQEQQKQASTDRTLAWLTERIPALDGEMRRLEQAIQSYKTEHKLSSINPEAVSSQEIVQLNRQLAEADADVAAGQARLDNIRALRARGVGVDALAAYFKSPTLTDLWHREFTLLQAQATSSTTFVQASPTVQRLQSELRAVRGQIGREVDKGIAAMDSETHIAAAQARAIKQQLGALQIGSSDPRLLALQREEAVSQRMYEDLQKRQEDLREQRESLSPGVRIVSLAAVPDRPSSISPVLLLPPTLVLSLICAGFIALIKEQSDRTLRTGLQLGDALGIPCIGLVPRLGRLRRARPHHWLTRNPLSAYSETIRSLVATLQLTPSNTIPKVILVTSSLPGEGKTTIAASFAAYAALMGRRVVLVDFDFRRPAVSREFGNRPDSGLPELLAGRQALTQMVQRAADVPLDLLSLPVKETGDPLKLLAAEQMQRLLRRLRDSYDCVVIDSAPVLATAEARLLAAAADKVLFIVKWASTRHEVARSAIDLLHGAGTGETSILGVITMVDVKKHARYHFGDSGEFMANYEHYYR